MYSVCNSTTLLVLGSPIRTSPDQSLLGSSPRLIAPCDVLHRYIVSRHPPYALIWRTTKTQNCALRIDSMLIGFELSGPIAYYLTPVTDVLSVTSVK